MELFLMGIFVIGLIAYGRRRSRFYEEELAVSNLKLAAARLSKELEQEFSDTKELIEVCSNMKSQANELNGTNLHQLSQWGEREASEGKFLAEAKMQSLLRVKNLNEKIAVVENLTDAKLLVAELQKAGQYTQSLTESIQNFLSKYR
ncbi:hypothetical protein [Burkholderia cepacia]|uniref:hypothetical protein n=1 Tax=Burkholderia cepacia TaxID=292 RepID=UPI001CF3573D|nr:hypothetical protein [Burkholderia cepacia]MCA8354194.1 hypothetical protein [Burkholderia cepacia]